MPRAMRVEDPGAIYHVMDRGDRQEDIFADGVDRQDFLQTLAEACRQTEWPPIKWIAARMHIGTAKGAKTVLPQATSRTGAAFDADFMVTGSETLQSP